MVLSLVIETCNEDHTYGILNLFDGEYYNETQIFDAWVILVDKPVNPIHVANIESRLVTEYKKNKRVDIRKVLGNLLNEFGYRELKTIVYKVDYSGFDRGFER